MKKYTYLFALALIASSCDDIILGEKIISRQDIKLKMFYESSTPQVTQVNDGLLIETVRNYTNGDTTDCEVVARSERLITKIDFDGNKIWERINEINRNLFNLFEDKNKDLWSYDGTKLLKFDSFLNLTTTVVLDFAPFLGQNVSASLSSVKPSQSGKALGLGYYYKGSVKKLLLCEIDEKGIRKVQDTDQNLTPETQLTFGELANGNWLVVQYSTDYKTNKAMVVLQTYSDSFVLLKTETLTFNTNTLYNQHFVFYKNQLCIFVKEEGKMKIIAVDSNLNTKQSVLTITSDNLKIIPSADAIFAYNYAQNIYKITLQTLESSLYLNVANIPLSDVSVVSNGSNVWFVGVNSSYKAQNSIVFNKIGLNSQSTKQLYESEYPRKCNKYLPK